MTIDLRSDTVTRPTAAMRRAMAEAEVGDDVYGEDPTVNRLEQRAAEIAGKEAALFVPTGTMGNTIGVKIHTQHGQEVICEARAHVLDYELAMMGWFCGCLARPIAAEGGILRWENIRREIRPVDPHWAPTGLIEIENTHNMAGGRVYPLEVIREIADGAHELGLKVHMDGARVFNAAEALGVPVREIVAPSRYGDVLPLESAGSAGGIDAGGQAGRYRPGAPLPEAVGRRHAAGGRAGGGGVNCTRRASKAASPRSCERKSLRRGAGEDSWYCARSAQSADEHHHFRRQWHGAFDG